MTAPHHLEDAVGDPLQVLVDLRKRARRLEHIEVPVEGNLVPHLRLLVVNPRIRRMR